MFVNFESSDEGITVRGIETYINKFSKKVKKGEPEELQLYGLAKDFNQNQTSESKLKLSSEFVEIFKSFPSIICCPSILDKTKKISLMKVMNLDGDEFYKQDKYTQDIVNKIIWWFITLCAEVNWGIASVSLISDY